MILKIKKMDRSDGYYTAGDERRRQKVKKECY